MKNLFKSRAFRQGSVATGITILVVALIVVVNMIVTALSERYALNADLTANKIFALSEDSKEFLASLDKDVQIYILNTEANFTAAGEYFVQANEVIKKYAQQSPRVKVEYIDLVRNPNFTTQYPDLQLSTSSILVVCGDRKTDLTPYDLYNIETDQYYGTQQITSSKAEQAMTSAMLRVTSDKVTSAVVLSGHNETAATGLTSLLELNNYTITEQNLLTEEINPDAKIAILSAPMRDLTEDELKKLDAFLRNGGKLGKTLLYFASHEQPELPNLSAFLADWGISIGTGVVFETSNNKIINMNPMLPIADYNEEVYSKSVQERQLPTLIPYSRPISLLFETKSSITTSAPIQFSQTSGIYPLDAAEDWQPTDADIIGPIPAIALAQQLTYEGTTPLTTNVVVCGSNMAVDQSYLSATSLGNSEYFLSMLNTLSEREDVVNIQAKSIGGGELGVQMQQIVIILVILLAILIAVIVIGIVVWIRRRHR